MIDVIPVVRRWRARKAFTSADILDRVVADQLTLVAGLSEDGRRRAADHLAELVLLSQAYRHYGNGWISRAELDRRGAVAASRLAVLKHPQAPQLTEQD